MEPISWWPQRLPNRIRSCPELFTRLPKKVRAMTCGKYRVANRNDNNANAFDPFCLCVCAVEAVGGKALPCIVDVRDENQVRSAIKSAVEKVCTRKWMTIKIDCTANSLIVSLRSVDFSLAALTFW